MVKVDFPIKMKPFKLSLPLHINSGNELNVIRRQKHVHRKLYSKTTHGLKSVNDNKMHSRKTLHLQYHEPGQGGKQEQDKELK